MSYGNTGAYIYCVSKGQAMNPKILGATPVTVQWSMGPSIDFSVKKHQASDVAPPIFLASLGFDFFLIQKLEHLERSDKVILITKMMMPPVVDKNKQIYKTWCGGQDSKMVPKVPTR